MHDVYNRKDKDKDKDKEKEDKREKDKDGGRKIKETCCMMLRTAAKTAPLPGGGTEWRVRLSLKIKYFKCWGG